MFVGALPATGGLLAYAPIAPTQEVLTHLASLSRPLEHILVPNLSPEHYYYAPDLADAFPEATLWVRPGLLQRAATAGLPVFSAAVDRIAALPEGRVRSLQGSGFSDALGADAAVRVYRHPSGAFCETALLFKDAGAVALADLAFGSFQGEGMRLAPLRWFGQLLGLYRKVGCPLAPVLLSDREGSSAWARDVLGWDWDTLLACHLTPVVADGKQELRRALAFLEPRAAGGAP